MKAVQQIITYLKERGRLGPGALEELVRKGYWAVETASDLRSLEGQVGQSFFFQVTGDTNGPVWGTDVYTSDSNLGVACVHAGVLQPGETAVVRVTVVQPVSVFPGSTRNGVTSGEWKTGWPGAYRVEAFQTPDPAVTT